MEPKNGGKMVYNMNPCNDCIVDMICTKKCPNFIIDLKRIQCDDMTYLKRCVSNHTEIKVYKLLDNMIVKIDNMATYWCDDDQGNIKSIIIPLSGIYR